MPASLSMPGSPSPTTSPLRRYTRPTLAAFHQGRDDRQNALPDNCPARRRAHEPAKQAREDSQRGTPRAGLERGPGHVRIAPAALASRIPRPLAHRTLQAGGSRCRPSRVKTRRDTARQRAGGPPQPIDPAERGSPRARQSLHISTRCHRSGRCRRAATRWRVPSASSAPLYCQAVAGASRSLVCRSPLEPLSQDGGADTAATVRRQIAVYLLDTPAWSRGAVITMHGL